jgi:hypothetical protein
MSKIKMYTKEISSANILSIEVGTNTPCGGDAGHGGKTIFKLRDLGATAWTLRCDGYEKDQPAQFELELLGDTEAETFIESLEFAISVLKAQRLLVTLDSEKNRG